MDFIPAGSINQKITFATTSVVPDVTTLRYSYARWSRSTGGITPVTRDITTELATIGTSYAVDNAKYFSAVSTDGDKFELRIDVIDAAFATGADFLTIDIFDDATNIVAHRIFTLGLDASVVAGYQGEKGIGVYLDASASNTNTVLGTDGIQGTPVSTFAAAKIIADALNVKVIYCLGITPLNAGLPLGQNFVGYTFVGTEGRGQFYVLLDSRDLERSRFYNLGIYGIQGGTEKAEAWDCVIGDPGAGTTGIRMDLYRCQLAEAFSVLAGLKHNWHDCYTVGEAGSGVAAAGITIDLAAGGIDMAINNFHGGLTFSNATSAGRVRLNGSGSVGLANTNDDDFTLFLDGAWEFDDQKGSFNNLITSGSYWNQFVRNSMQLAVTDGTGATGSIDEAIIDPIAEPAQGQPPVTPTFLESIQWRWANWRNKSTETATVQSIQNDAGTVLAKRPTQSDDGVTFTNSKFISGA